MSREGEDSNLSRRTVRSTRSNEQHDIRGMEEEPERLLRSTVQPTSNPPLRNDDIDQPVEIVEESRDSQDGNGNRQPDQGLNSRDRIRMNELKKWTSQLIQEAIPDLVETALQKFVRRESFEDLIEECLIRVLSAWVAMSEEPNVLTQLVQTEIGRLMEMDEKDSLEKPRRGRREQSQDNQGLDPPLGFSFSRGNGGDPDDEGDDDDFGRRNKAKYPKGKRRNKSSRDPDKDRPRRGKSNRSRKKRSSKDSDEYDSDEFDNGTEDPSSPSSSSSDSSSDDSDSDERSRKRQPVRNKANLKIFVPLNDWFKKACNWKTYLLKDRSRELPKGQGERMLRYRKRLDNYMRNKEFDGSDPITLLSFLKRYRGACNKADLSEGQAVMCLRYYLKGQAHELVDARLEASDDEDDQVWDHVETLHSYAEAVNFLIHTYVTDEVISEEYHSMMQFRQATNQSETEFGNRLFAKAQRSGIVFTDRHLKSMFADNVSSFLRRSVNTYLSSRAKKGITYLELVRYAQGLGDQLRGATKRTTGTIGFTSSGRTPRGSASTRQNPTMAVEWTDEASTYQEDMDLDEEEAYDMTVALAEQSVRSNASYSNTSTDLTPTSASGSTQQSVTRKYFPTHPAQQAFVGTQTRTTAVGITPGLVSCRLCLGEHPTPDCTETEPEIRDRLIKARDKNYAQRREDGTWVPKGMTPTAVYQRGGPSTGSNRQAAADANPGNSRMRQAQVRIAAPDQQGKGSGNV